MSNGEFKKVTDIVKKDTYRVQLSKGKAVYNTQLKGIGSNLHSDLNLEEINKEVMNYVSGDSNYSPSKFDNFSLNHNNLDMFIKLNYSPTLKDVCQKIQFSDQSRQKYNRILNEKQFEYKSGENFRKQINNSPLYLSNHKPPI